MVSRPPFKRRRFHGQTSTDTDHNDVFTTSSTAHIFAAASTYRSTTSSVVLHPRSYEVTLNHDTELKRSLHPSSLCCTEEDSEHYGTRLVTWTSSCGTQKIMTDRYDAVHLLPQLPTKSKITHKSDDTGWSDLDSDTEDLFFMTSDEAATFTHQKAKAALEAQHSARLNQLGPASFSTPPPPPPEEASDMLSEPRFELMQKTAKVVSSSTSASLLELKILANHGGDSRFAFLRKDGGKQQWSRVWEALKTSKGEMSYQDALKLVNNDSSGGEGVKPTSSGGGLVAYDDSDSESESDTQLKPVETEAAEATPPTLTLSPIHPHTFSTPQVTQPLTHLTQKRKRESGEWNDPRSNT